MIVSHYGRSSRGHPFPPTRLQETKNSAFHPFTLEAKVQRSSLSEMPTWHYSLTNVTDSQREFGTYKNGKPNYGRETVNFCSLKLKINWNK